jgi:hypothetical protein
MTEDDGSHRLPVPIVEEEPTTMAILQKALRVPVRRLAAMSAPVLTVLAGAATPPPPEGRIYALHSQAIGGCPSLDWYMLVETNDIVAGMIAWDDMKTMFRATGQIDRQSNTFTMTASEIGGQARIATVGGQIRDNGTVIANIKGPNVACDSVILRDFGAAQNFR